MRAKIGYVLFVIIAGLHANTALNAAPLRFGEKQTLPSIDLAPNNVMGGTELGRINRDGLADVVIYDCFLQRAFVALSTGQGFQPLRQYSVGLPPCTERLRWFLTDVNSDGIDDFVHFNMGADDVPGAAVATVAINTGNGFSYVGNPVWNPSFCASYQTCFVADINGDGKSDIIAITQDFGTVFYSLSTGSNFGPNVQWGQFWCARSEICTAGDVDGDRKADLMTFKRHAAGVEKGNVLIARATENSFTDIRLGHGFFCVNSEQCYVADVNGDGKTDIIAVKNINGIFPIEVLVSLSNGNTFVNPNPGIWAIYPVSDGVDVKFADMNGDGKSDIVGYRTSNDRKLNIWVRTVTDQLSPLPEPLPEPPLTQVGFKDVLVYNCDADQRQLFLWTLTLSTGYQQQGSLFDAMYSAEGFCPDPQDPPRTIALGDGQVTAIIGVDPQAIGCEGRNDPTIVACAKYSVSFRGNSGGPSFQYIMSPP